MRARKLTKIIESVQHNRASHDKYLHVLKVMYNDTPDQDFFKDFRFCLLYIFLRDTKTRNLFDIRALEFMAKFCVSLQDAEGNNPFLSKVINAILEYNNSANHNVRYHICQFIQVLMKSLAEIVDGIIDDDICDKIIMAMKERINDIKPTIRQQAIFALQRLQDPYDINDPVTKIYLKTSVIESNSFVRRSLITSMCSTAKTAKAILVACLSKDDSIRLVAYEKLTKVQVNLFKVEDRQYLLRNGLKMTNPHILKCINEKLLPKWLDYYNGNYMDLMRAIWNDSTEEEMKKSVELIEKVLMSLFKNNPNQNMLDAIELTDDRLLEGHNLNFESCLYWRCLLEYLHSCKEDDGLQYLDKLMPDLSKLVTLINRICLDIKQIKNDWFNKNQILLELLKICLFFDFLDETSRKECRSSVVNILTETKLVPENIALFVQILEKIIPNTGDLCVELCQVISNIREPLTHNEPTSEDFIKRDLKLAPLRVNVNEMTEDMEIAVNQQDFLKAGELKKKISEARLKMENINDEFDRQFAEPSQRNLLNDPDTISRCLDVLIALLQSSAIDALNDPLRVCMNQFVKPLLSKEILTNTYPKVLKCFGLFMYLDKTQVDEHLKYYCTPLLMYRYLAQYTTPVIVICCEIITDLLILFGQSIFVDENDETSINKSRRKGARSLYNDTQLTENEFPAVPTIVTLKLVIEILSEMLDDSELEFRETSTLCLVKLMMNNLTSSSIIFSKFVIKWFNPITQKDQYISQLLGVFFENYVKFVPESHSIVEDAFIPTLQTIANAPSNSPLVDINIDSLIKFLVMITNLYSKNLTNELYTHKNLLISLGNEMLKLSNDIKEIPLYLKSMLLLDIPYDDNIIMQDLKKQAENLLEHLQDKNHQKLVQKYLLRLNGVESSQIINCTEITEDTSDQTDVTNQPLKKTNKRRLSFINELEEGPSTTDNMEIETASSEDTEDTKEVVCRRRSMRKSARKK